MYEEDDFHCQNPNESHRHFAKTAPTAWQQGHAHYEVGASANKQPAINAQCDGATQTQLGLCVQRLANTRSFEKGIGHAGRVPRTTPFTRTRKPSGPLGEMFTLLPAQIE